MNTKQHERRGSAEVPMLFKLFDLRQPASLDSMKLGALAQYFLIGSAS